MSAPVSPGPRFLPQIFMPYTDKWLRTSPLRRVVLRPYRRPLAPLLLLLPRIFIPFFLKSFLPCTLLVCNYVIAVYDFLCVHILLTCVPILGHLTYHSTRAILPESAMLQEVYGARTYSNTILTLKVEFAIHYT